MREKTAIVFFQGFREKDGKLNGTTRLSIRADNELREGNPWLYIYYARTWNTDVKSMLKIGERI